MSWSLHRWVWRLESPLHIGLPPSGSLNRCRLYVPARALWGALAAEIARWSAQSFPSYREVGDRLRQDVRLTYLYPAEPTGGGRAWLPRYVPGHGLVWELEDEGGAAGGVPDRELRSWLLLSRAGTAIDPETDSAAEGTLRETECVGQYWRDGEPGKPKPVRLVGYVMVREGSTLWSGLEQVDELFLGGDTRYGLGRVRCAAQQSASTVFDLGVELGREPVLTTNRILAHAPIDERLAAQGDLEALAGWDHESLSQTFEARVCWRPGSVVDTPQRWRIRDDGRWTLEAETTADDQARTALG